MTVDITEVYKVYTVTREQAGEIYPITFPFISSEYVKCYYAIGKEQTQLVYGTEYTVDAETKELTIVNALPIGSKVVVYRVTDCTQEIDWVDGQSVYTPDIEQADDKITHILQELAEQTNRSVKITREEEANGTNPEYRWEEIEQARREVLQAKTDSESAREASFIARNETFEARDTAKGVIDAAKDEALVVIEKSLSDITISSSQAVNAAQIAIQKAEQLQNLTVEAETLTYPNAATAEYSYQSGRLFLGIPEGKPGLDGDDGKDGLDGRDGVDGLPPAHMWDGTNLSFQNPDGTWGVSVNLKGDVGPQGQAPSIDIIDCGGACDFKLTHLDAGLACSFVN